MSTFRGVSIKQAVLAAFVTAAFALSSASLASQTTIGPATKKTLSALHGRLWDEVANLPVSGGYVFALDSSCRRVLGHSTTQTGRGPDSGRWQIVNLPPSGNIWLVGFHPEIKMNMAVREVTLQGRYEEIPGLSTSMHAAQTADAPELGGSPLGVLGLMETIAKEANRTISERRTALFAQSLLATVDRSEELLIRITDPEPPELHGATRRVLAKLHQPVVMKLYYAHEVAATDPTYLNYFDEYCESVRRLLMEYVAASRGMLQLQMIDPKPYSEDEEAAIMYGLEKILVTQDRYLYLGLVIETHHGFTKVIPILNPDRQHLIEYDVTSLIDHAITRERRRIGILSSLPLMGDDVTDYMARMMSIQGQKPKAPWTFVTLLKEKYEVTEIDTATDQIEGIDLLLVVHPKNLPETTLLAIERFVFGGGRTIVCIDPYCYTDRSEPQSATQPVRASELNALLRTWGLTMPTSTFSGDKSLAVSVSLGPQQQRPQQLVAYLKLVSQEGCFARHNVITSELGEAKFLFAGVLDKVTHGYETNNPASEVKHIPLVMTTCRGNGITVHNLQEVTPVNPSVLTQRFVPGSEPVVMGYLVRGRLRSGLPYGLAAENATSKGSQNPYPGNCAVVVFSDVDFISDGLAFQDSFFGKTVIGDNYNLLSNTITCLLGSDELVEMLDTAIRYEPRSLIGEIRHRVESLYERELSSSESLIKAQAEVKGYEQSLKSLMSTVQEDANGSVSSATLMAKKAELEKMLVQAAVPLRRVKRKRYEKRRQIRQLATDLRAFPIPGWVAGELDLDDLGSLVLGIDTNRVRLRRRGGGTVVVVKETSGPRAERPPVITPAFMPAPLIQGLDISQVKGVQIDLPDKSISFVRSGDTFGVVNKHQYPARTHAINDLIESCLDITVVDVLTDNANDHPHFGVTTETAQTTVQFLQADSALLAGLIIGRVDQQRRGYYVRLLPGDKVYVTGQIPSVNSDIWHYVDQDLLSLVREDIESVIAVSAHGEHTVWTRQDAAREQETSNPLDRGRFLQALCTLQCDDMYDIGRIESLSFDSRYICSMRNSMEYTLMMAEKDGRLYVQCKADTHMTPVTIEPGEKASEEELKRKEAKLLILEKALRFTQRHKKWVYRVPRDAAHELTAILSELP